MPTNGEVPCVKQVIKKYIREVPCPAQTKRKQNGQLVECKKAFRQIETVTCPETERRITKCVKRPLKINDVCGENDRSSPKGCPKCEQNRLQKLECEVYQLRREIEHIKHDRKEVGEVLQNVILRSACALGGGYSPRVPASIEKLLNCCESDVPSTSSSFTICGAKPPAEIRACVKTPKKKKEFGCCQPCCLD